MIRIKRAVGILSALGAGGMGEVYREKDTLSSANSNEISPITSLRVVLNWCTDLRSKMK